MKKRILCIALVLCMALTLLPLSAFAAAAPGYTAQPIPGNEVKINGSYKYKETEPNNDFSTKNVVGNGYTIIGDCTYEDHDVYKFSVSSEASAVVYSGSDRPVLFSIIAINESIYAGSETQLMYADANDEAIIGFNATHRGGFSVTLSPGTYYIIVYSESVTDTEPANYYVDIDWVTGSHKHSFTTEVKAPTCENQGYTIHNCSCGRHYCTDFVAPLGHNYVNGKCSRCGELCNPFVDVNESAVYYDAILWAYYHTPKQITAGTDSTHFSPAANCTRGQVVTFLWRAAGCPEPTKECPFVDVSSSSPYYKAILWAAETGITNGMDATHFAPNATVTRAQFVTFLWRYEDKPEAEGSINNFKDAGSIAKPYQEAVAWAVGEEIAGGYNDGTFRPNATCTRWAVVLFMYRDLK